MADHFDIQQDDATQVDPELAAAVFQCLTQLVWKFPRTVMAVNIQVLYREPAHKRTKAYYQPAINPKVGHERFLPLLQQLFSECTDHQKRTIIADDVLVGTVPPTHYSRTEN